MVDTGPGIPADALPHVFDRFYRADRGRSRATGGSGLGLAIVRDVVEAHGGTVTVVSPAVEGGTGTRLLIDLPGYRPGAHPARQPRADGRAGQPRRELTLSARHGDLALAAGATARRRAEESTVAAQLGDGGLRRRRSPE